MAQITKKDVKEAVNAQVEKEFLANAEIVFQVLYFTVNDEILKLLIWTNEENYKKFTAEIFANDLYNDLTGQRSGIRRSGHRYTPEGVFSPCSVPLPSRIPLPRL